MVKKKYWVGRIRTGSTIEIKIKDETEALLDWWEINLNDKRTIKKVLAMIKSKYGFDILDGKGKSNEEDDIGWLIGNS